jgi:hypothetical protein
MKLPDVTPVWPRAPAPPRGFHYYKTKGLVGRHQAFYKCSLPEGTSSTRLLNL